MYNRIRKKGNGKWLMFETFPFPTFTLNYFLFYFFVQLYTTLYVVYEDQ